MQAHIRYVSYLLRSSFWFMPAIILVGSVVLSCLTVYADGSSLGEMLRTSAWSFRLEENGARLVLSTIAGSMITVTSLVYSLTLVALTMASGQLGPRLLTVFMRDRITQVVLGTFLATFVYSLLVLTTIGPEDGGVFIPHISVVVAFMLALLCFSLLIFFIHHVADGIQADSMIATVGNELDAEIARLSQSSPVPGPDEPAGPDAQPVDADAENGRDVCTAKAGYLQTADFDSLAELCRRHGVRLKLAVKPGDFLLEGHRIGTAWPSDAIDDAFDKELAKTLVTGPKRTPAQDLGFRVHALVEIALRALSPGINDTRTAIACVDRLTASIAVMMTKQMKSPVIKDNQGHPRLFLNLLEFEDIFDIAFTEIRQSARGHLSVILRQIENLSVLAALAPSERHLAAIRKHGEILQRLCEADIREPIDGDLAKRKLDVLWQTLDAAR